MSEIKNNYVYFIQCQDTGHVKIGHSNDVLRRLEQLQTGNSGRLVLIGFVPGGSAIEKSYHHAWQYSKVRGEWFDDSRLVEYIEKYCTGELIGD
jgi:hypothetical protein